LKQKALIEIKAGSFDDDQQFSRFAALQTTSWQNHTEQ
jgi:hypothetical protein